VGELAFRVLGEFDSGGVFDFELSFDFELFFAILVWIVAFLAICCLLRFSFF
jgi:hypothetical protein